VTPSELSHNSSLLQNHFSNQKNTIMTYTKSGINTAYAKIMVHRCKYCVCKLHMQGILVQFGNSIPALGELHNIK